MHLIRSSLTNNPMLQVAVWGFLGVLPIFFGHYLPCVDLPQHAGQVALFSALHQPGGGPWAGVFEVHWFTPYLFGYLLMIAFSHLVGIVMASKIVMALALWCLPMSTASLMRVVNNDPRLSILTIPTLYGFTFSFGFLNFLIAIPIGVWFMVWVLRYTERRGWMNFWATAISINLLFFCHALIWALFFGLATMIIFSTTRSWRSFLLRMLPLLTSVPIVLYWFVAKAIGSEVHGGGSIGITNFPMGWWRFNILPLIIGSNHSLTDTGFGCLIILAPWLAGFRLSTEFNRLFPLICCLLILLVGPHAVMGISFIYERFAPLAVPFYLFAMQARQPVEQSIPRNRIWIGVGACLSLFIFNESLIMSGFAAETADFDAVLRTMQPNQHALSLVFMRSSYFSPYPVYLHFPLWYQAEKTGIVDYNFAYGFMLLLQFRNNSYPANTSGFEWSPQTFDWRRTEGWRYRYFMIRAPFNIASFVFREFVCRVHLLSHAGTWWVYEQNSVIQPNERNTPCPIQRSTLAKRHAQ